MNLKNKSFNGINLDKVRLPIIIISVYIKIFLFTFISLFLCINIYDVTAHIKKPATCAHANASCPNDFTDTNVTIKFVDKPQSVIRGIILVFLV